MKPSLARNLNAVGYAAIQVAFGCGLSMDSRFMLAPLSNIFEDTVEAGLALEAHTVKKAAYLQSPNGRCRASQGLPKRWGSSTFDPAQRAMD